MSIADKLTTVAENVLKVYESGKQAGVNEFWDTYLGVQYYLDYAFVGGRWNTNTFRPTKDLSPVIGHSMFYRFGYTGMGGDLPIDLEEHLNSLGIKLDTSRLRGCQYMFRECFIKRLGVIDFTSLPSGQSVDYTFYGAKNLVTIDKLIVAETTKFSSPFNGASKLENLTIEGTIGQKGFSVANSENLTKASITSIINALSGSTSGISVMLSKTAVNKAFETSEGAKDGSTSALWSELEATKTNWTISLA